MSGTGVEQEGALAWVDDDPEVVGSSAWIEREQFVYFVTMARELGNPGDWQPFRDELVSALRAAWGIDAVWLHLDGPARQARRASRLACAYAVVDQARDHSDPVGDWDAFVAALWSFRGPLTRTT